MLLQNGGVVYKLRCVCHLAGATNWAERWWPPRDCGATSTALALASPSSRPLPLSPSLSHSSSLQSLSASSAFPPTQSSLIFWSVGGRQWQFGLPGVRRVDGICSDDLIEGAANGVEESDSSCQSLGSLPLIVTTMSLALVQLPT